jgi:hypothetical protein
MQQWRAVLSRSQGAEVSINIAPATVSNYIVSINVAPSMVINYLFCNF